MNNLVIFLELQRLENLDSKPPDQALRHALKVVVFDELVQVDAQAFKGYHQVLSEQDIVFHSDDIVLVVLVMEVQVLQDFEFDASLVLKLLLVPDEFDRHCLLRLVIQTLDGLAKASLSEELQDFISVAEMVLEHHLVIPLCVIEPVVVDAHFLQPVLGPFHRFDGSMLDDVPLDLSLAVLSEVVDFVAE